MIKPPTALKTCPAKVLFSDQRFVQSFTSRFRGNHRALVAAVRVERYWQGESPVMSAYCMSIYRSDRFRSLPFGWSWLTVVDRGGAGGAGLCAAVRVGMLAR